MTFYSKKTKKWKTVYYDCYDSYVFYYLESDWYLLIQRTNQTIFLKKIWDAMTTFQNEEQVSNKTYEVTETIVLIDLKLSILLITITVLFHICE